MVLSITFNHLVNLIFSLGLFFNALLFVPQAIKIFKSKNSQGLSLVTFAGFNVMQFFTALHGYLINDLILMSGFLLSFFTCGLVTLLIFKYTYLKRDEL